MPSSVRTPRREGYYRIVSELDARLPRGIFDAHIHVGFPLRRRSSLPEGAAVSRQLLALSPRLHWLSALYPFRKPMRALLVPFPYSLQRAAEEEVNRSLIREVEHNREIAFGLLKGPRHARELPRVEECLRTCANIKGFKYHQQDRRMNALNFLDEIFTPGMIQLAEHHALVFLIHLRPFNERVQERLANIIQSTRRLRIILAHGGMGTHRGETFDLRHERITHDWALTDENIARHQKWINRFERLYRELFSLPRVYADTALLWNEIKLSMLIRIGGHGRLLFGSDLPYAYFSYRRVGVPHLRRRAHWARDQYQGKRISRAGREAIFLPLLEQMERITRVSDAVEGRRSQAVIDQIFWYNAHRLFV